MLKNKVCNQMYKYWHLHKLSRLELAYTVIKVARIPNYLYCKILLIMECQLQFIQHIQPSSLKLSTYPSQSDLMNLVAAPLPTKWRLVGIQLGLSMSTLDEIENSHPHDCKRCFMSVFSAWESQGTSPYSWTTIVEALRSSCVEENVAAAKIEQTMANYSESM